jgi:hypothetical protein
MTPQPDAALGQTGRPLLREIERTVGELLAALGFRKHLGGGILTLDLGNGIIGWIGLNHASYPNWGYKINPIVGVRHQELERLRAEMNGNKPHQYLGPTLATSLVQLMGGWRPGLGWEFPGSRPVLPVAKSLVEDLREYALPYFAAHDSLEKLTPAIRHGIDPDTAPQRLAIAHLLAGRPDEGERILTAELAKLGTSTSGWAMQVHAFVEGYRRYVRERATALGHHASPGC